ncbi:MAG: DsbA family protein [Chloroflexi bacterium]|nr:DsbA family protein [Chloroflexota bacterium]
MPTKTKKSTPAIEQELPGEEEFVIFRRTHFYSVLVVLAFAVGLLVGYVAWGRDTAVTVAAPAPAAAQPVVQTPQATPVPVVYEIETDGFPSLGPADAPITIVEFSDYQCPFCYRWHVQVYDALMQAYPDQIRFVYRNFPLSFHQNAFPAAEAALCAGDQDAYWEYHAVLFDNQDALNNQAGTVLEQSTYSQYASDLGLDAAAFDECMTSRKYQQFIQDDMAYASSLPNDSTGEPAVGGTPTFFINGYRLGGAYPIEYFKQIIDAELGNN